MYKPKKYNFTNQIWIIWFIGDSNPPSDEEYQQEDDFNFSDIFDESEKSKLYCIKFQIFNESIEYQSCGT